MSTGDSWPARLAALEQASAEFRDGFAPLMAAYYKRLIQEGLPEYAATELAVEFQGEMFGHIRRAAE